MTANGEYRCEYCGESFANGAAKGGHVNGYHSEPITTQELVTELRDVARLVGQPPTRKDMDREGRYSSSTIQNRFGSWNDGLRAAGIEVTVHYNLPDEALIEDIRDVGTTVGGTPTAPEMGEHGTYSRRTAQNRFGSWNDALRAAGFEPNQRNGIPREELLHEIGRLANELGRPPRLPDLEELGCYSKRPYFRVFGGWDAALEAAGYDGIGRGGLSGTDHPNWNGGHSTDYGSDWERQRSKVLDRDGYTCQMPGCPITTERHIERFGAGLHVHHIVPLRMFSTGNGIDHGQANAPDNLVTLCQAHHQRWERMAPLRPDIRHLEQ